MPIELTHVLVSSDFLRYYFSRTPIRGENKYHKLIVILKLQRREIFTILVLKNLSLMKDKLTFYKESFRKPDLEALKITRH